MNITAAIYFHPEAYPPTLNAINVLSEENIELTVITRRTVRSKHDFSTRVNFKYASKLVEGYTADKLSFIRKIWMFVRFTILLYNNLVFKKPKYLLLYDPIPLYSYFLIQKLISRRNLKVWYHNHDTIDMSRCKKYSILWFAARNQDRALQFIDYFSLPSEERKEHFPLKEFNGMVKVIPNYPSMNFNPQIRDRHISGEEDVRLIYQGSIGANHGLEQVLEVLNEKIEGHFLKLILVGKVRPEYLESLFDLAEKLGVMDRIEWKGYQPYVDLHKIANEAHIGLAIHKPYNVTYSTGGTASNKIYEYAACGLPVILFDSEHYRSYLEKFKWSFFTDISSVNLLNTFSEIVKDYKSISNAARKDVECGLNFEHVYKQALKDFSITFDE